MTRPDKRTEEIDLKRRAAGVFETSVTASQSGLYRFHLKASGLSSQGHVFTREQQFTAVIGRRPRETGDCPENCGALLCALLKCFTTQDDSKKHLIQKLEAMGVNRKQFKQCVEVLHPSCCESSHQDKCKHGMISKRDC